MSVAEPAVLSFSPPSKRAKNPSVPSAGAPSRNVLDAEMVPARVASTPEPEMFVVEEETFAQSVVLITPVDSPD